MLMTGCDPVGALVSRGKMSKNPQQQFAHVNLAVRSMCYVLIFQPLDGDYLNCLAANDSFLANKASELLK